jgi:hypothetical protein
MKRYIENMHKREPHERRAHALRVASAVTMVVFVGWLATLGLRLASVSGGEDGNPSQTASVLSGLYQSPGGTLEVSSSSYTGY